MRFRAHERSQVGRRSPVKFVLLASFLLACGESPGEPLAPSAIDVFVLNSTGQTLASFAVGEELQAAGAPVDLGAGFDGAKFDLWSGFAVTTVSSFGGSRLLFVDLQTGDVVTSLFPGPSADLANPSAATFDETGTAWVGGRGSDAVYTVRPGDAAAQQVATGVGTFIERVLPVGDRLYVVDANLDDDGGSYLPLGSGRIAVLSRTGATQAVIDLPATALNPIDAVAIGGDLVVLAGGTFDSETFLPNNDGAVVVVDMASGVAGVSRPLSANGVSLELGGDGHAYITTTADYLSLDVLRFDADSDSFDRGPDDPIVFRGGAGDRLNCWAATALADGRLVCATFSYAEAGRLVLADREGRYLDEVASGFGSTDVAYAE